MHSHHAHPEDRAARLVEAQRVCAGAGETLTPVRQKVLELLWAEGGPAKAYDLLAKMGGEGGAAKPPTVYRALDFLVRLGLAHRIESLNAFAACGVGACARTTIFLICDACGDAQEIDAGHAVVDLDQAAAAARFQIRRTVIEASGVCAQCQAAA